MHYLRSYLHRNIGGITNKLLYEHLRVGTKQLIEDYNKELVKALQFLCLEPSLTLYNKLDFFNETKHSYGRSALLLSGGILIFNILFKFKEVGLDLTILESLKVLLIVICYQESYPDLRLVRWQQPLLQHARMMKF